MAQIRGVTPSYNNKMNTAYKNIMMMKIVIFRKNLLQILDNNGVYKEYDDIWKVKFINNNDNDYIR